MERQYVIMSTLVFAILAVSLTIYIYSFYLPTTIDTSPEEGLLQCNTFQFSGEGAINMLYFGKQEQVAEYTNYFFETPPYSEFKDRFNIYYIDNYLPECDTYKGIATFCHSRTLIQRAASCPNDYIIVLVPDLSSAIRSSSYLNVVSVNIVHPSTVLIHEFAHTFANLADEYVPAGKLPRGQRNCATQCEKFEGLEDGCFEGCTDNSHERSIKNGVMRTLNNNIYGGFNEFIVKEAIKDQSSGLTSTITGRQIRGETRSKCVTYSFKDGVRTEIPGECSDQEREFAIDTLYTDGPPTEVSEPTTEPELEEISGETIIDSALAEEAVIVVPISEEEESVEVTVVREGQETIETVEAPNQEPSLNERPTTIQKFVGTIFTGDEPAEQTEESGRLIDRIIKRDATSTADSPGTLQNSGTQLGTTNQIETNTTEGNETNQTLGSGILSSGTLTAEQPFTSVTAFIISELKEEKDLPLMVSFLIAVAILILTVLLRKRKSQ